MENFESFTPVTANMSSESLRKRVIAGYLQQNAPQICIRLECGEFGDSNTIDAYVNAFNAAVTDGLVRETLRR